MAFDCAPVLDPGPPLGEVHPCLDDMSSMSKVSTSSNRVPFCLWSNEALKWKGEVMVKFSVKRLSRQGSGLTHCRTVQEHSASDHARTLTSCLPLHRKLVPRVRLGHRQGTDATVSPSCSDLPAYRHAPSGWIPWNRCSWGQALSPRTSTQRRPSTWKTYVAAPRGERQC